MVVGMHWDDGPYISLLTVTPPGDGSVLTGGLAAAGDRGDAAGMTVLRLLYPFLAGFLENEMEDDVEIVRLGKYPETPLPREMIDMEVQNLERAEERERRGWAPGRLCNVLNTALPCKEGHGG